MNRLLALTRVSDSKHLLNTVFEPRWILVTMGLQDSSNAPRAGWSLTNPMWRLVINPLQISPLRTISLFVWRTHRWNQCHAEEHHYPSLRTTNLSKHCCQQLFWSRFSYLHKESSTIAVHRWFELCVTLFWLQYFILWIKVTLFHSSAHDKFLSSIIQSIRKE